MKIHASIGIKTGKKGEQVRISKICIQTQLSGGKPQKNVPLGQMTSHLASPPSFGTLDDRLCGLFHLPLLHIDNIYCIESLAKFARAWRKREAAEI